MRKDEAAAAGKDYEPENVFSALHVVKSQLWGELSRAEKSEWREKAKISKTPELELDQ